MSGADSDAFFTEQAGRVLWPRTPADLTDTARCPACQSSLTSPLCATCGLDLRHPVAAELLAVSTDAAAALDRRVTLIGRIRYDTDQAFEKAVQEVAATSERPLQATSAATRPPTSAVPPATTLPSTSAVPTEPVLSPPSPPSEPPARRDRPDQPTPATPADPSDPADPARPKRSSVQILMLIVGVLLVAVAAIFFLTLAWLFAGLAVRSVIGAVLTLSALTLAAVLRRKLLVATAEGIGALAVVLVVLDAWAVRQNNLFGLASTDALLYWGAALGGCSALFFAWHALSRLRVASMAGFLTAPVSLALVATGLASDLSDSTRFFLAFLGAAIGALLHRATFPSRSPGAAGRWPSIDRVPERMALVGLGSLALVSAAITAATLQPDSTVAPLWSLGAVTVVAVLHVAAVLTSPPSPSTRVDSAVTIYRAFGYGSAVLAAVAACTIAPVMAGRADSLPLLITAPVLVSVTLALAFELIGRRRAASPARRASLAAASTAAAMAALFAIVVVGFAVLPLCLALTGALTGGGDPVADPSTENWWALFTLAATGGVAALFWSRGALFRARRPYLAWLTTAIIIVAVPFAGALWLVLTLFVLVGSAALAVLLRGPRHPLGSLRVQVVALLCAATTGAYVISWASTATWWVGTLFVATVLMTARRLCDAGTEQVNRSILLSGALVVSLSAAGIAPWALTLGLNPSGQTTAVNVVIGLALATGLFQLMLSLAPRRLFSDTERCWAFYTLLLPTVIVFFVPVATLAGRLTTTERANLLLSVPPTAVLSAALLGAAATTWVLRAPETATLRWPRLIAAAALAPVLLLVVAGLVEPTDAVTTAAGIIAPLVALAACAFALIRATDQARPALEIGAALILVPSLVVTLVNERPLGWLALLIAGLAAAIVAVAPDGLFASRSARRHVGWLAIGLGTAGLWLGLVRAGTEAVEPYVLPVAAVLLGIAALIRRFGRVPRADTASPVASFLTLVGLVVALVPLAIVGQSGSLLRPLLVGALSAVLLLGASWIRWTPPRSGYLAAAGAAGGLALFVTAAGRIFGGLGQPGIPDGRLEIWLLVPCACAVVAAILLTRSGHSAGHRVRPTASRALVLAAVILATTAEMTTMRAAPNPADATLLALRVALLVLVLSGLHVLALRRPAAPLGAAVAWSSITLAGVAALSALSVEAVHPFELLTVPVGLALVLGHLDSAGSPAGTGVTANQQRAVVVTAGLMIAVLPSAVAAGDGSLLRPILALLAGGTLAITGALLTPQARFSGIAGPLAGVGLLAVAVTAIARIGSLPAVAPSGPDGRLEGWLVPTILLLSAAGAGLIIANRRALTDAPAASTRVDPARSAVAIRVGYGIIAVALVALTLAESSALGFTPLATARAVTLVWLLAGVHLALLWLDRSREGRQLGWIAVSLAGCAALAGVLHAAADPLEILTVPLAVALLLSGWLHLERTPAARSWRWCAPGLLLLLVPSLLSDVGGSALWRIVALGVVAVIVVVTGLVRRLQAPFVIGAVVLLIHGTAQLWPWISLAYGAVPWWLWLGVGGILLIVLAARYEQRIRNLTSIALKISALR
ncbi:hypothetical protein JF66_10255 [Cryobacterium sp. MLB-32]|uniref:SCO7613 C-terminal domain-containing membrane protein n=1 Tax=Cryobacterium sp. MLB-32 TaxID=1529318 RepID=UPI0004E6C4D4|nr:hypothetical protein [Cryobacterium sp. MLB-32]KFF59588.1 hypothetical protein JF66_10255 [Cryobacterium sp. MLB-32]